MKRLPVSALIAALCASAFAQTADAPPVDAKQLLDSLRQLREQNDTSTKTRRSTAYQQVMAAAASNEKAAAAWAEAVLAVQFAGVDHQTQAVRDWQQDEGQALRSKEASNAARLHLHWLGLTLQHASGTEIKQLLNSVIDFTRQVQADMDMIEKVEDQIDKARANAPGGRRAPANKALTDDTRAKKLHDGIMRMSVVGGPVAKRLQVVELLGAPGGRNRQGDAEEGPKWEPVPGNVDGIFQSIILPEFRANKDPRLLEYWDMALKRDAASISPDMPDFQERQATQVRRPKLLWERAQDILVLGQRNRAVTEMFNIIKAHPQHPEAAQWMAQLEGLLAPPALPTATLLPGPATGTTPAGQPAVR